MTKNKLGLNFFILAMIAFMGLGMEIIIGLIIEPIFYGCTIENWSTSQNILHWIITCIVWGLFSLYLISDAKRKYDFDIFKKRKNISKLQRILIAACIIFSLITSYIDWNGFKIQKEFIANGWLKFIFQYIYYIFETGLFLLIIVFSQKAGEFWSKKKNIPWGGITVALTWGFAHILTKGSLISGLVTALGGLLYGIVYLLTNKNSKISFPILFIMFTL